jgi:hypothetical protein
MSLRFALCLAISLLLAITLSSCGGGSGSSGGNGGGGGGGSGLSVTQVAPSSVTVGVPLGGVTVYGQGFTEQSIVLIDGQQGPLTTFTDSGTLNVEILPFFADTAGTHQFSVQTGSQTSNSQPLTVYAMQEGPFVMQAIPGFLVGELETDPPYIIAADVNGDGLADVVMQGPGITNGSSIAILTGQKNGTLSAAVYVPVPDPPAALAVGDIDGNGTPDLVPITNLPGSNIITVSTLLGDGHGNFQSPVVQQSFSGNYPTQATLADLDGDGTLDLLLEIREASGNNVVTDLVWLKNTAGQFAAPVKLATIGVLGFNVADFNGDGKPDILYGVPNSGDISTSLHILINQGNATFTDQAAVTLSTTITFMNVMDFNLDGIPDLIVQVQQGTSGGVLYSYAGNGNGTFTQIASLSTPGPITVVAGDFDHDGFPDLAGPSGTEPSQILYFFGDGHGNFTQEAVVGPEGSSAAVGDFNGDGIDDLVIPDRFSLVSLALGRTDRNFPSPTAVYPATILSVSVGDINGDGLPEILTGGNLIDNIPGTVFLNQGSGAFSLAAYTDPTSFMLADLTGKGVVNLLGGNANLEIWPNNGTLGFTSSPITFTQQTGYVSVADMDGDGHADVISGTGQIFYGNGAYQFTAVPVPNLESPYVIGNFKGDGKLDIATASGTFLNMGSRTFQEVSPNNLQLSNGALAVVADFNGDGKDDVAISQGGDNTISIYYSNGDGTFYEDTIIDPGQLPGALSVGDFNADGRIDLAVAFAFSQQTCMLFNSGNGQFTRSFFASGAGAIAMVTADMNNDGKPDLVIGNFVLSFESANVNVVLHQ